MNIRVDKDNERAVGMEKVRDWKVLQFSRNAFWKNIGCLVLDPNFCLGRSVYQQTRRNKSLKKRKIISIRVEVYVLLYIYIYILYYNYTNIHSFSGCVASITPGERSSGSIGHKDLSHKRKSNTINGGGQGC